jgi:hypothetical protein
MSKPIASLVRSAAPYINTIKAQITLGSARGQRM